MSTMVMKFCGMNGYYEVQERIRKYNQGIGQWRAMER